MTDAKFCEICNQNPLRYELYLDKNVTCPYCKHVKYEKGYPLFLCSTACPDLYWYASEYLSPKNAKETKVIYALEKDECAKCGKRDFPGALFVGKCLNKNRIQKFVFDKKIKIDQSVFDMKIGDNDPIVIRQSRIRIYLPKIKSLDGFYSSYYMTLKSKNGFTMSRLGHAAYQLLMNAIEELHNGVNIWEKESIKGIEYDSKTFSAYITRTN